MKRPFLNLEERQHIYRDTIHGNIYSMRLAYEKLIREARKTDGVIGVIKMKRQINKYLKQIKL